MGGLCTDFRRSSLVLWWRGMPLASVSLPGQGSVWMTNIVMVHVCWMFTVTGVVLFDQICLLGSVIGMVGKSVFG